MKNALWKSFRACHWCKNLNEPSSHWCQVCSHAAHLPKQECDCAGCVAEKILPGVLAALAERQPKRTGESASFPE